MGVPRYTTPTFTLTFAETEAVDLTQATNVYVTLSGLGGKITKTGEDLVVAAKSVSVKLTQAETGSLGTGDVRIQVNWTDELGNRAASEIAVASITEQLLAEVVP